MTASRDRRSFLKQSAYLGLSGFCPRAALALQGTTHNDPRPRKVIVAGAGIAGLTAAFELMHSGHSVTVLEARMRPGGASIPLGMRLQMACTPRQAPSISGTHFPRRSVTSLGSTYLLTTSRKIQGKKLDLLRRIDGNAMSSISAADVTKRPLARNPNGHSILHQRSTRSDVPGYGTNTLHQRC
jgi:FAD dependent oxidoreductase